MGLKIETYENGVLVSSQDNRSIDELRQIIHDEINAYREYLFENEPVFFQGAYFDIDRKSQNNIAAMGAAIAAGIPLPSNFVWRTFDNQDFTMNTETFLKFAGACMYYINAVYSASWVKKMKYSI